MNETEEKISSEITAEESVGNEQVAKAEENTADIGDLKKYFPEYDSYENIPKEAKDISEKENIPIFDAYLRYRFFQDKKVEEEKKNREKNSEGAVGSLKTHDSDYGLSYINAMLKAIRKN